MTTEHPTFPIPAAYPLELTAPGTVDGPAVDGGPLADLPEGSMRRVTHGDLDVLVVHTPAGVLAIDDRCPHMAAPLSIGELEGCVVQCPLHEGRFDLCSGDVVQMPTTGGLDAQGVYHPTWSPAGKDPKVDPPGKRPGMSAGPFCETKSNRLWVARTWMASSCSNDTSLATS